MALKTDTNTTANTNSGNDNAFVDVRVGTRKLTLTRYEPDAPLGEETVGTVDFGGRVGKWSGYAVLDTASMTYHFVRVMKVDDQPEEKETPQTA